MTYYKQSNTILAFTAIELITVIATIALLIGFLLPTLSNAREKARTTACVMNLKQLQFAWFLYTDDNMGLLPENYSEFSNNAWRSSINSWTGPSSAPHDPGHWAIQQGTFCRFNYIKTAKSFHCPSDDSEVVNLVGNVENISRSRTYSMNGNFGGRTNESQTVLRRQNFSFNPSSVFVFLDEHEDSIDDGHFLLWSFPDKRWVNLPTGRHNQSGNLSFADGHLETWKWKWKKSFQKKFNYWQNAENKKDLTDLRRLQKAQINALKVN